MTIRSARVKRKKNSFQKGKKKVGSGKFVPTKRATRNPADVKAGIDQSRTAVTKAAQTTKKPGETTAQATDRTQRATGEQRVQQASRGVFNDPFQLPNPALGETPLTNIPNQKNAVPQQSQLQQPQGETVVQDLPSYKTGFTDEEGVRHEPVSALKEQITFGAIAATGVGLGALSLLGGGASAATATASAASTSKGAGSKIAQSAAGKLVSQRIVEKIPLGAGRVQVNVWAAEKTGSWLAGLASSAGTVAKNPAFIASTLIGAIGSYPFAGFIKEEAAQQLSFGLKTALDNNDVEGAQLAVEELEQLLDPGLWGQILGAIPYANTLNQLKNFYDSSRTKLEIDKKAIETLAQKQAAGFPAGEEELARTARIREGQLARDAEIDANIEARNK